MVERLSVRAVDPAALHALPRRMWTGRTSAGSASCRRAVGVLSAWCEAPELDTARERAAEALTEAVTLIDRDGGPDDIWADARQHLDEAETVQLLMVTATVNVWNRLAVNTQQQLPDPR